MKRMGVTMAAAAVLLVSASTVLSAANKEQQQLMAELRMLQQHQQQLQQMVVALTDALKLVTGKMDEQAATSRKALADQRLLVEGMTDTVRVLREKADDTNVRLSSITQEIEAVRQTMASLPQPSATPAPGDPAAIPDPGAGTVNPAPTTTAPPPVNPPPANVSPQRTYDTAFSDYAGGQWDLAIVGFETFLKYFPRHTLADDAQLNIGNALYNAGKYREAVAAYQRVIADYAKTDSVPSAYYKMGESFAQLKEPDLARKAYQTLMDTYPNAPENTLARQALVRLGKREF
jgi:tol-pal system protein YbgF